MESFTPIVKHVHIIENDHENDDTSSRTISVPSSTQTHSPLQAITIYPSLPATPATPTAPKSQANIHINTHLPQQEDNNERNHFTYANCEPITGKIYTDQTGQFLTPSHSGNKYMFILYDYESNYIDIVPMPSKTKR